MPDIYNLTLLGAGYFCVPIPILELFSRMWLHSLETVSFLSLAVKLGYVDAERGLGGGFSLLSPSCT